MITLIGHHQWKDPTLQNYADHPHMQRNIKLNHWKIFFIFLELRYNLLHLLLHSNLLHPIPLIFFFCIMSKHSYHRIYFKIQYNLNLKMPPPLQGELCARGLGGVVGLTLPMARTDRGSCPVYYLPCSDLGQVGNLSLSVA